MRVAPLLLLAGCHRVFGALEVPDHDPIGDDGGTDGGLGVGIVAHYEMESLDGTMQLIDSVGGHNGICSTPSCPSPTAGIHDGALDFDGLTMLIDVPNDAAFMPPNGFT